MQQPSINEPVRMFCRECGYALVGLTSNRCPECGREFDPSDSATFRQRPLHGWAMRALKIALAFFCISLPADCYFCYLSVQAHKENKAIQFLDDSGQAAVTTRDTTPGWLKVLLHGHAAYLWRRADKVDYMPHADASSSVPQCMAAIGNLKCLRVLWVYGHAEFITDNDLSNLRRLSGLKELWVSHTKMTDSSLKNFKDLTSLHGFSLGESQITGTGLVYLQRLPVLQELELRDTQVTDIGLVEVERLTNLRVLDLSGTSITDMGLVHLKRLTALRKLDLGGTQITDAGLGNLQDMSDLQDLNLERTQVTDSSLPFFKNRSSLQRLNLTFTNVTDAGVEALRRDLANCTILHPTTN